jgi:RING finger protein 113A
MPPPAAPGGFKQRKNRGNLRKRGADDEGSGGGGGDDETAVVRKAKQTKGEPLAFSTKKDTKDEVVVAYESNRMLPVAGDSGATRILETETEFDRDAR